MTILTPTDPPDDFEDRVQAHVDEVEFQHASLGETTNYLTYAEHIDSALTNAGASLVPNEPEFWRAVAVDCRRRDQGVITPANRDGFG